MIKMRKKVFGNVQKALACVLAVGTVAGSIAGCAGSGTGASAGGSSSEAPGKENSAASLYNEPGQLPIVNEPITLTIFAPSNGEFSWLENEQTKELEELTGIHIEWKIAAAADNIRDKISTMFASGNMPDIILTGVSNKNRFDRASESMFGSQGLVLPLDEYLDTVSVGYQAAFEKFDGMREAITSPDGHIYSLPNVDDSLHVQYPAKLWMNGEWLDRLGLEIPKTPEELHQVLKAFKEQDANGNGDPNDEIPLSSVSGVPMCSLDVFLMDPFQLTPIKEKLYLDNGKVTFAPIQDGYKEGLKYIHTLYEEGLINPESFTQDMANQVNINEAGEECVFGSVIAQHPGYYGDLGSVPNSGKWEQYVSVPPLQGADGQSITPNSAYGKFQTGMTFITSNCENPEAAFRFLDYLATYDGSMRSILGEKGVDWRDAEDGEIGINGESAIWTNLESGRTNQFWEQLTCLVRTPEMIYGGTVSEDLFSNDVPETNIRINKRRDVILYEATKESAKAGQPIETVMPELYMNQDQAEESALLKTTIMDNQNDMMVQFITGAMDIDKDWDTYKQKLDGLGLEEYLQLLQSVYDESAFAKK